MTSPTLNRRQLLHAIGTWVGVTALAACAQPAPPTQQPAQPTQLVATQVSEPASPPPPTPASEVVTLDILWNGWAEEIATRMEEFGKSFMGQHPNITLEWAFSNEWREKLLARVAAGDPPDVCYTNSTAQAGLASQGAFLALDDYIAQANLKRADFLPGMWDQSLWDGKLYAIPGGADFIALFYSKTAYKAAGLDPEAPPNTASELIEHSLKLLRRDAVGNLDRVGYGPNSWDLGQWGWIFGGEWYDATNNKITANDPKNVEALTWMVEYVKQLGADKLAAFQSSMPDQWSPGNPFMTGRSAYVLDGYWQRPILDDGAPDLEYGVTFWPTLNGTPEERSRYNIGGWMVGIGSGSTKSQAAWLFVDEVYVAEAWRMACETVNGCSLSGQMDQFTKCVIDKIGSGNRLAPYFHVFGETGLAATKYWPIIPAGAFYYDEQVRAYDAAASGQKTPQEALDELTEVVQKEVDKG